MAPRTTRSSLPGKAKAQSSTSSTGDTADSSQVQLPPSDTNAPKTLIVPQDASANARIVSLPSPVNGQLVRYLYCPDTGLYEYSSVKAPQSTPRSWLLSPSTRTQADHSRPEKTCNDASDPPEQAGEDAYILEDPDLYLATPFDPLFLLTPLFMPSKSSQSPVPDTDAPALPLEDHLSILSKSSPHMSYLLRQPNFRTLLEDRLKEVSELRGQFGVEAYKPDAILLVHEVIKKARKMTEQGTWPQSLEQEHVQKPLEPPASIKSTIQALESISNENGSVDDHGDANDRAQPAEDETDLSNPSAEIVGLLRLRVAVDYIFAKYVRADLRKSLRLLLGLASIKKEVDFGPLDHHLEELRKSRQEALALREMSDNISRKRGADNDEAAEARAEKKRKREEEDKKKKQESRALKDLKKTDTSGMKKLSAFFTKGTPKGG